MARRVFFSFHYKPDVQRAQVPRKAWVTKASREEAGFFDSSVFESKQRTSDDALKTFLANGLKGCSVTAVLFTEDTAFRRWVRYELLKSFAEGKGLLAIDIHSINNFAGKAAPSGPNPLNYLGYELSGQTCYLTEKARDGQWRRARDVKSFPLKDVAYPLAGRNKGTLGTLFEYYNWMRHDGYQNLSRWVESAAQTAGR